MTHTSMTPMVQWGTSRPRVRRGGVLGAVRRLEHSGVTLSSLEDHVVLKCSRRVPGTEVLVLNRRFGIELVWPGGHRGLMECWCGRIGCGHRPLCELSISY